MDGREVVVLVLVSSILIRHPSRTEVDRLSFGKVFPIDITCSVAWG